VLSLRLQLTWLGDQSNSLTSSGTNGLFVHPPTQGFGRLLVRLRQSGRMLKHKPWVP